MRIPMTSDHASHNETSRQVRVLRRQLALAGICAMAMAASVGAQMQTDTQREMARTATQNRLLLDMTRTSVNQRARSVLRSSAAIDVEELVLELSTVRLLRTRRRNVDHQPFYLLAIVDDGVMPVGGFQAPTLASIARLHDPNLMRCDDHAISMIETIFDPFGLNLLNARRPGEWRTFVDSATRNWRKEPGNVDEIPDDSLSLGEEGFIRRHTYLSPLSLFSLRLIPVRTVVKCDKHGRLQDIIRTVGGGDVP